MKSIWTLLALTLLLPCNRTAFAQQASPESFARGSAMIRTDDATAKVLGELELKFEAILDVVTSLETANSMDAERSMIEKAFYGIVAKATSSTNGVGRKTREDVSSLKKELLRLKIENERLRSELLKQKKSLK